MKSQQPLKQRSFRLTKSWLMFQQLIILMTYSSHSPLLVAEAVGDGTSEDLEQMFQRMEADTINWAKHMESLILPENRCSSETLNSCSEANYNSCISEMPHATCPGAENRILACGKGEEGGCSGLFDFTATKVSLTKGDDNIRNPSEREKDGVCHTLPGDEYIIEQRESRDATDYWNEYKVSPPWYHYGNDDGIFRILPGSPEECASGSSTFDPRIRPWYVAASSGPKDIILILDTSGSMSNYGRLSIMQEAAARVVGTLGVSDYVSVIEFNDNANHVGGAIDDNYGLMERADDANKKKIIEQINTLQADGNTNFEAGFDLAFKTFKNSINNELTSGCHKAILFLTDGQITGGASATTSLMNLMTRELSQYSSGEDRPAIFTYSFGSGADSVVPKQIACNYNGIWASIDDGGDLANSMGAYYKYFAYGLSGQENADFVAWVAPYAYSTTGELGTTASVPVYDRSVDPPVLAGVVGLDFSFVAMERALGDEGEKSRDAVLERIVERSIARCPNLNLTACQLESLREYGAGDDGNAGATCGNVPDCATKPLKSPLCKDYSQSSLSYPNEIWNNDNNKGRTYEEKVCCSVGEEPRKAGTLTFDEVKDLVCEEKSDPIPMIIGIVFGVVGLVLIAFGFRFYRNRKKPASTSHATAFPPERPMGTHNQGFHTASAFPVKTPIGKESVLSTSTVADPVIVLPPPTAPNS